MAKRGPLIIKCYLIEDRDKEPIPFEELTPEQLENAREKWRENLSRRMSDYFTAHPEEFETL